MHIITQKQKTIYLFVKEEEETHEDATKQRSFNQNPEALSP